MNLTLGLIVVGVLVALRVVGTKLLFQLIAMAVGLWVFLSYGFEVPIPQTAINIYMSIATLALVSYAASSADRVAETFVPLIRLMTESRYAALLAVICLAIPAAAAYRTYAAMNVPVEPPYFGRTIHPAPPPEISVHGESTDIINGDHPYRELGPEAVAAHVANGRRVYYENCFYCHGDALGGDGMFAYGLDPIPTNFQDANVLPNFRDTFFYWRVAKGGPGMPDEGGPGDSAMPAWEKFLSTEEIWDVILFLYEFTDYKPRAKEDHGGDH